MANDRIRGRFLSTLTVAALVLSISSTSRAQAPPLAPSEPRGLIHRVTAASQRLTLTANSSKILTLGANMVQARVMNPDLLTLTLIAPNQIQVFAEKAGVTTVHLWDADDQVYAIDVVVYGDARELEMTLALEFPNASIHLRPITDGVLIGGTVDQPDNIRSIMEIAGSYYEKVIPNIRVGGGHQVVLHVKVMEVSRTKLNALGFDWRQVSGNNVVASTVSGLMEVAASGATSTGTADTFKLSVVDGANSFLGVLEALRNDNLMKILAEPTLVTVSGRPAFFRVGGEFPVLVPQSLGTVSIEYKQFGTQVDFVPRVLGNGLIHLEVRPRVSEIDASRSVEINSYSVPGISVREVDTGVQMMAGQTLAIAGLVQTRVEAHRTGLPWVSDLPYVGGLFRKVEYKNNEIELLILVTPNLVEAMDPHEVPSCGPGTRTGNPTDRELFMKGHIEVPNCQPANFQTNTMRGPVNFQASSSMPMGNTAPLPTRIDQSFQIPSQVPSYEGGYTPNNRPIPSNQYEPPLAPEVETRKQMPGFIGPVGFDVVN